MVAYFDNGWSEQSPYDYVYPESQSPSLFYNQNNIGSENKRESYNFYKSPPNQFQQSLENSVLFDSVINYQNPHPPTPVHYEHQQHFQPCVGAIVPPVAHPHYGMIPNQNFLPPSSYNTPLPSCGPNRGLNALCSTRCNSGSFTPSEGQQPWNYANCYGYYGDQPCQYVNVIDIEDFMSNEKRKEKSRDAARCRRSRETEIFTELGQVLPLQREEVEQLDKASIMRLSIAYLKIRDMLNLFPDIDNQPPPLLSEDDKIEEVEQKPFDLLNGPESYKYLSSALDGFLMILSGDGDVTYVSENIPEYLGISQIDLLGQQIWEYTHQCDHDELKEALNMRRCGLGDDKSKENGSANGVENNAGNDNLTTAHRDIFLRLKCTLTSRGRSVNIKSASYKVIHLTGHMVMNTAGDRILISVGRPLPHPSNIEIPLGSATFLTKHSLDMKFTYVDDKMLSLLGYEPEDLLGKSLYDCHHGGDSESLMITFKSVLSKGQGETCRYRFLGKCGGYCWVVTQATIVYDKQKPQSVVCVNYAVSELENNNEIYSCAQLEAYRQNKEIPAKDEQPEKLQHHHQPQPKFFSAQKLQNVVNVKNNSCAVDARLSPVKTLLKQTAKNNVGESQPITVKSVKTPSTVFNPKDSSQPQSLQSNNQNIAVRKRSEDISLSPVRRTLTNCALSPSNVKIAPTSSSAPEKRPKSVTASVFTQVPINTELISTLNHQQSNIGVNLPVSSILPTHQQLHNQLPPSAPAKSVTASVLMPISALTSPINRSFLPSSFSKTISRNTTGNNSVDNNNSSNSTNTNNSNPGNTAQDMNRRYLMFSEESPELTMLKEEPDDLTHLAPSLDDSTQLFGEMLDSLILPDAYGTLLSDDINSLDSQQSNCNNNKNNNNHHIDPFINYRDESSDTSSSPHLLSPGSVSKSPEMSSIPSLCSPNSLSQDDEFAFMTMNVEDDIDLTMRAPYIPMNEQEDLPLLTEDLMWSAFSEELSLHKEALQMEALKNSHNNALNNNNSNSNTNTNSSSSCMTAIPTITSVNQNNHNSSQHNSSNKNNISTAQDNSNANDNESSLAALLCGNGGVNSLHQHQSHHSPQSNIDGNSTTISVGNSPSSNDCKRRKMVDRNDNFANSLMDSIDDFGPVFSKNSSNVDCWTMSDLLQMNDASPVSSPSATLHQQAANVPEKQNIIINTAIPTTTVHVPLITLQNRNSNSKISCNTLFNVNESTNNSKLNNCPNNPTINSNSNTNAMRRLSATLVKGVNINVTQVANNNSNINSGKSPAGNMNLGAIVNTQNNTSSKRPSNIIFTSSETKRLKNSPMMETPASPQLLQQLMAPSPQRPGSKASYDKMQSSGSRWSCGIDGSSVGSGSSSSIGRITPGHQSTSSTTTQSQSSNSVLKNLLVSGCDDTFGNEPPDTLMDEDQLSRSLQNSPQPNFYDSPLLCTVSTEQVLRRRGINPLIGGEGILPSPPIPIDTDADDGGGENSTKINLNSIDSLVANAYSPIGSESSGSDSGIECGATPNRGPSLIQTVFKIRNQGDGETEGNLKLKGSLKVEPPVPPPDSRMESIDRARDDGGPRKISFSFLDEDNPLCSPFLMDFCNDMYSMDEPMDSEFLQGTDLTRALNEWSTTNATT